MICAWTMPGTDNYHSITEYPELDGIHKDQRVQLLPLHRTAPKLFFISD